MHLNLQRLCGDFICIFEFAFKKRLLVEIISKKCGPTKKKKESSHR